jgi:hypothetical protein
MRGRIGEVGTTGTDRDSAGGDGTGSELGGEASLADPGFADDEGEASGTGGGFSPAPQ